MQQEQEQKQFKNFGEIRQIFVDLPSGERSEKRTPNVNITWLLDKNFLFRYEVDPEKKAVVTLGLRSIESIHWNTNVAPIDDGLLEKESQRLQEALGLKNNPSSDLSFGGKFWAGGEKTELSGELQVNYYNFMKTLERDSLKQADAAHAISATAHWLARNSGATWSEAVECARYAATLVNPNSNEAKIHGTIVNLLSARHNGGGI